MRVYLLVWGQEILKQGTKQECLRFYYGMKNPYPMDLMRIDNIKELVSETERR